MLVTQVTYLRQTGISWIKMIFWLPWDTMRAPEELRTVIDKLESDTNLVLQGFASSFTMATTDPAVEILQKLMSPKQVLWLQIPNVLEKLSEGVLLYQIPSDEETFFASQDVCPDVWNLVPDDGCGRWAQLDLLYCISGVGSPEYIQLGPLGSWIAPSTGPVGFSNLEGPAENWRILEITDHA